MEPICPPRCYRLRYLKIGIEAYSCVVVFQFANDIRAGKKVCYTLSRCPHRLAAKDATLSRWISRVRIPLGAPFKSRSPLPSRWRAFCYRYAGIRTQQGAELRKRASVFQRSTQGAERRSGSGRRQPHADIPLGAPTLKSSNPPDVRSGGFVLFAVIKRKVLNALALDKQLALLPLGTNLAKHLSGSRKHDRI